MAKTLEDDFFKYRWGWSCEWFGWRRMLWLSVVVDFKYWLVHVVLLGFAVSYGRQLVKPDRDILTINTAVWPQDSIDVPSTPQ